MNKLQTLILVDKKDKTLGYCPKDECHKGKGLMHRAFMVFFLDKEGKILLTKRSKKKPLWPEFWDASVVSHVLKGENYKKAAVRRAKEEIGIKISENQLKEIGGFSYRSEYQNVGSENEYCQVLVGKLTQQIKINSEEISDFKFLTKDELLKEVSHNQEIFTPWFKIGFRLYLGSFK